ncbi:MAG: trypsin-like peptidase domain-containing protein [Desulfobacteraceae bacterium]|nr:trypsin-like peptidase domain-containing protein [Desulfobacteraceae bacterium]
MDKNFKERKTFVFILVVVLLMGLTASNSWSFTKEEDNNIEIYRKSAPGVVNITSTVMEWNYYQGLVPREGAGSGAIIDTRGYILTNNHVIKDAQRIEVTLSDGSKWNGKLVGTDPYNDLAIVRIEAPSERLHALPLGSSRDLQVGQKVIAIGNPFGLQQTLTTGIISSLGRSIPAEGGRLMEDLIQTDAAINPGNSGGPLLDSEGKIIGLNTAIFSPTGGSIGIGFAIPIDTAKRIIPEIIKKGYVSYPWLGVNLFPLLPGLAQELNLKVERGVMIVEVVMGGPAEKAGLRGGNKMINVGNARLPVGGDVVVAFEGKAINSPGELVRMLIKHRPGDRVTLRILREGLFKELPVILGERPRQR